MRSIYDIITEQAQAMIPQLRRRRRDFHTYAESGWFEIRTSSLIAQRLTELGYEVLTGRDVCLDEGRMGLPPAEVLEEGKGRLYRRYWYSPLWGGTGYCHAL